WKPEELARSIPDHGNLRGAAPDAAGVFHQARRRVNAQVSFPLPTQVGPARPAHYWCRTRASPSSVERVASEASRVRVARTFNSIPRAPHPNPLHAGRACPTAH